ncbi:DUF5658 family protein [Heyndrickxia acidicola]|uniref:DUF5658 family protein n=1 Tax=Heyndrickxia acidicola TaxID=209389 RepID=A0ABU6MKE7_9BACI|nr:DUF5658 family protein [Heyndrickxia acidicola]MED1204954.1 DUF5658 family protein [Heyndrickxia acidicola]
MKWIIHYLAFLNIIDALATYFGLNHSYIREMNPLMESLYNIQPLFFLAAKLLLSVILYSLLYFEKIPVKNMFKAITVGAATIYTFVVILHSIWLLSLT